MDYAEEQSQELEALQSIYDADFDQTSPTSFSITVKADDELTAEARRALGQTANSGDDEGAEDGYENLEGDGGGVRTLRVPSGPHVILHIELPPTYPEVAPELSFTSFSCLGASETEESALLEELRALALENLGMASSFTLTSHLKDRLEDILRGKIDERNRADEERFRIAEEVERKRLEGTKVTPESFAAWRAKFEREMAELAKQAMKGAQAQDTKKLKPSGRQLFEQDKNLAKSDLNVMEAGEVAVDVDLFEMEDDAGLDDDEDDNEVLAALRADTD
ncbi:hypothetical protein HDU93_007792 [Gonapodya sp. JEL0774]|nr:hypothetical protein HDU93_007792 [Gonapodya sp. JEL0774]